MSSDSAFRIPHSALAPSRRELLARTGMSFGLLGLAGTMQSGGLLAAPASGLHFPARAKRVIVLFMNGGPSHVDTFDPKPALKDHAGKRPTFDTGRPNRGGFVPSPFAFAAHGSNGVVMSELFPNLARCADDLCVVRSMHTDVPNHEPGLLMMNSGNIQPIRPSLGSWVSYGLGTENQNLPGFVVLAPRRPVVGPQLWANSFLPGSHQGVAINTQHRTADKLVADLSHPTLGRADQQEQIDLVGKLDRLHAGRRGGDPALDANIRAMETAFAMQAEAADAFDISKEPAKVREAYGDTLFGRACLMARRLSERGVRFVQAYYLGATENQPWDTHSDNDNRHRKLCGDSDRATAALLTDLKERGLLDDTLVVWTGEFGRTPYAEIKTTPNWVPGRDHHHWGFTTVLAGGGVKGGYTHGATDEVGMHAVEGRVHVHDLHATMLHLMGVDHEKLTYRYSGRDFRLTDVKGRVVRDLLS